MHGVGFVGDLAIVLGVATLTAVLARLLKQPTILGYLVAGLIVGPYLPVPLFADTHRVEAMAELGVVLVMFAVGLEFQIAKLFRVLPISGVTALVQVGFLLWAGYTLGALLGWSSKEALFLGSAICISSTMVVTRLFSELEIPRAVREHVLGILVIQDVLAIVIIASLTAIAAGEGLEPAALATVLAKLSGVLLAFIGVGLLIVPRGVRWVAHTKNPELLAVIAAGLCFMLGSLAEGLGFSVALGAFVAGILVAESGRQKDIEHLIAPMRDIFAAVFFVSIGMTVDPLQALQHLPFSLLLVALIIVGQLLSVSLAGALSGSGLRRSLFSAFVLGQIGELAFIISSIGIQAGIVRADLQPVLVTVAALTAFTTPLAIRWAPRAIKVIDGALPGRVHRLLSLYESWFERWRERPRAPIGTKSPARHAMRNLAFDGLAATVVVALAVSWAGPGTQFIEKELGWSENASRGSFGLAVLVLLLPLLFHLIRNSLALSKTMADEIAPKMASGPAGQPIVRRLVRSTVHLLVTLAVGIPGIAVLRPLLPGPFGLPILLLVLGFIATYIFKELGNLDTELRSGAAAVAERLSAEMSTQLHLPPIPRDPTEDIPTELAIHQTLPGLDGVRGWKVPPRAWAEGLSLAQADLRAATGVAVVTIQRGPDLISLPNGGDIIQAGDTLGMLGSPEALAEAQSILLDGPKTERKKDREAAPSA